MFFYCWDAEKDERQVTFTEAEFEMILFWISSCFCAGVGQSEMRERGVEDIYTE